MATIEHRNKSQLEKFLRTHTSWHLYALADLDDPLWGSTRWFASVEDDKITGVVILIQTMETPILYGICSEGDPVVRSILRDIEGQLPERFFAHVGLGVMDGLKQRKFHVELVGSKSWGDKSYSNFKFPEIISGVLKEKSLALFEEFLLAKSSGHYAEFARGVVGQV